MREKDVEEETVVFETKVHNTTEHKNRPGRKKYTYATICIRNQRLKGWVRRKVRVEVSPLNARKVKEAKTD